MWDFSVIKEILSNPVYIRTIASQKVNYRFKLGTLSDNRPEYWICVEDMHEVIIDRNVFETVQQKIKSRRRPDAWGNFSLFSGIIKCGECGKALTIRKTNAKNPINIYSCVTYNKFGKFHCTQHRVEYAELYRNVLEEIQRLASEVLRDGDAIMEKLPSADEHKREEKIKSLNYKIEKDKEPMSFFEKMVSRVYVDYLSGAISKENFDAVMSKTQSEQSELKEKISQTGASLVGEVNEAESAKLWFDTISEYANITELDAVTLNRLIKEIVIHETIDENRKRNVTAEIHFNIKPISA